MFYIKCKLIITPYLLYRLSDNTITHILDGFNENEVMAVCFIDLQKCSREVKNVIRSSFLHIVRGIPWGSILATFFGCK